MFDALFGDSLPIRFFVAFILVLALIALATYLVRRFGPGAPFGRC